MMRLMLSAVVMLAAAAAAPAVTPPDVIDLWPATAPGESGNVGPEKATPVKTGSAAIGQITNVSRPTITVSHPAKDKNTGVAILVAPGGGYNNLAWDHEGEQVANWLNSIGVTAAVLKYRVPRRPDQPKDKPPIGALQDAQRALGLIRSRAGDWGVDPKRVGMLGFSAGGHLTAWAATNFDHRAYPQVDAADTLSSRPDFAVMIYPGGVIDRAKPDQLAPEITVTKDTPPCFFAHAWDDRVSPENSLRMALALKAAGVSAELHIYAVGGHGFGMRPSDKPYATWPRRCEEWMKSRGVLAPK